MSTALGFFHDLGLRILDRWKRVDFDSTVFPDLASAALIERPPSSHVAPMDVIRGVLEAPVLVPQLDIDAKFGQPPITVFRCDAFYIAVLFWVDGTTEVHQHSFAGAFHVMDGSSIHSVFRFNPAQRYSEYLSTGELALLEIELLTKGDVRAIRPGSRFVHSLFHLDRPSVSVVVRTVADPFAGTQHSYSRAGIAFDPFTRTEAIARKLQLLDLLHHVGHVEFETRSRETVREADAFGAFTLAVHLMRRIKPFERYVEFLESLRPAHESLIGPLIAHAGEDRREEYVVLRRGLVESRELRFFLALLLNVPSGRRILEIAGVAWSEPRPVDAVLRWTGELARLDRIHAWVADLAAEGTGDTRPTIVDARFDGTSAQIARHLLHGLSEDDVVAQFGATHDEADVRARCTELRTSLLLQSLFRM